MTIVKVFVDKIIIPVVLAFLVPILTGLGSKLSTGNWWEWFARVSMMVWIGTGAVLVIWIIIAIIRSRFKKLQSNSRSPISIISIPYGGWRNIGTVTYAGVKWNVRVPKTPWYELDPKPIEPHELDIETPPRCPKCETELEQNHSFWGGYTWKCVKCGFHKHNKCSYYVEDDRAKKIAKRDFEIYQSKARRSRV